MAGYQPIGRPRDLLDELPKRVQGFIHDPKGEIIVEYAYRHNTTEQESTLLMLERMVENLKRLRAQGIE